MVALLLVCTMKQPAQQKEGVESIRPRMQLRINMYYRYQSMVLCDYTYIGRNFSRLTQHATTEDGADNIVSSSKVVQSTFSNYLSSNGNINPLPRPQHHGQKTNATTQQWHNPKSKGHAQLRKGNSNGRLHAMPFDIERRQCHHARHYLE